MPPGATSPARNLIRHRIAMDTTVTIEAVACQPEVALDPRIERAFGWFTEVEAHCSRFDPRSELSRLCDRPGQPIQVSGLLFNAIRFALAIAADSDGAFDPAVGDAVARSGFATNYKSGKAVAARGNSQPSFRDVVIAPSRSEVTVLRPLTLDLGAVAKGMAIDLAAQELEGLDGFVINAGGDIFASGLNAAGRPWTIGIRHPRDFDSLAESFVISGAAVCTSGDYERTSPGKPGTHHLLDPRNGDPVRAVASATVVGPTAMAADALATAAFVLGPHEGIAFLERNGVEGLIISPSLERYETAGLKRFIA